MTKRNVLQSPSWNSFATLFLGAIDKAQSIFQEGNARFRFTVITAYARRHNVDAD